MFTYIVLCLFLCTHTFGEIKVCEEECIRPFSYEIIDENNQLYNKDIVYPSCDAKCRDKYAIAVGGPVFNFIEFDSCTRECKHKINYIIIDFEKYESCDKECQNKLTKESTCTKDEYTNGLLIGLKNKKYTDEYFNIWVYSEIPMKSYKSFKINSIKYIEQYGYIDDYAVTSIKIY